MLSDQDDHIRRNIVLVSSGILLAAWLELPGSSLLSSVLPNGTEIAPYKLWAVGYALLAYLGLRYKFSNDGKEFQAKLRAQVRDIRLEIMVSSLDQPVMRRYSYEDACKLFSEEQLGPLAYEARQRLSSQQLSTEMPWVHIEGLDLESNVCLQANVTFEFKKEGYDLGVRNGHEARPRITWPKEYAFFRFEIPATFLAWTYSSVAIQYMAPIALAVTAEVVMLTRLVVSYLAIGYEPLNYRLLFT